MAEVESTKNKDIESKLKGICQKCKKPVRELRSGSFTSWIFSPASCTCMIPEEEKTDEEKKLKIVEHDLPALGPDYEIQEILGEGGMGKVYLASCNKTKEQVAIKVLRDKFSFDESASRRFEQEVEAASKLDHPNLGKIIDHGKSKNGQLYMVMEYIQGRSLDKILARGKRLTQDQVLKIAFQLCDGLEHAHENGVVHRDIKPSNVIVDEELNAKLIDFGIAKLKSDEFRETIGVTKTGEVFGSPLYMSPEQCLGIAVDTRCDIYSLGCLLCELVTGQVPFVSENPVEVISMHLSSNPSGSNNLVTTTSKIKWVILKCLHKNVENRYQSVAELKHDLEQIKAGKRTKFTRQIVHAGMPIAPYRDLMLTILAVLSLGFLASVIAPVPGLIVAISIILWISGIVLVFSLNRCWQIGISLTQPFRNLTLLDVAELLLIAGMVNTSIAIIWTVIDGQTERLSNTLPTFYIPFLIFLFVVSAAVFTQPQSRSKK